MQQLHHPAHRHVTVQIVRRCNATMQANVSRRVCELTQETSPEARHSTVTPVGGWGRSWCGAFGAWPACT